MSGSRRRLTRAGVLLAVVALLAGCGGGGDDDDESGDMRQRAEEWVATMNSDPALAELIVNEILRLCETGETVPADDPTAEALVEICPD